MTTDITVEPLVWQVYPDRSRIATTPLLEYLVQPRDGGHGWQWAAFLGDPMAATLRDVPTMEDALMECQMHLEIGIMGCLED